MNALGPWLLLLLVAGCASPTRVLAEVDQLGASAVERLQIVVYDPVGQLATYTIASGALPGTVVIAGLPPLAQRIRVTARSGDLLAGAAVETLPGGDVNLGLLLSLDTADRDRDGVPDAIDDCPDVPDGLQTNRDGQAAGDACEAVVADVGMPDDLASTVTDLASADVSASDLSLTDLSTPDLTIRDLFSPDLIQQDMSGVVLVGLNTTSANPDNQQGGIAEAYVFTAALTGTARNLWMYIEPAATASNLQIGIYSENANLPQTLLTSCNVANPTPSSWVRCTLNPAIPITQGTHYWLSFLVPLGQGTLNYRNNLSTGTCYAAGNMYASLPTPWPAATSFTCSNIAMYATP